MAVQQVLQECLNNWRNISELDYCLMNLDETVAVTTCPDKRLPSSKKIQDFLESTALGVATSREQLFKIHTNGDITHLLIVWGKSDSAEIIGELAVCQIESLLNAYREKNDKNIFMQNVLLGTYNDMDIYNKAKKLRISTTVPRAVFMVETKQNKDENALATIRNIFSARTRDFITALDDNGIIIVRELQSTDTFEDLLGVAYMLVDMLNTEVMTPAWVSFGNIAHSLNELPNAFRETKTAIEVGKIFYSQKNVFSYNQLGIGRLIYQLPVPICEMFIDEIFKNESLDSLDEETLTTIKIFFENNLNLSETSRQLYVHRNTLVYRFEKLQKKFGLDIRTFEDALTFKLAMMVVEYIKYSRYKKS